MKFTLVVVIALLVATAALTLGARLNHAAGRKRGPNAQTQAYLGLRNLALQARSPIAVTQQSHRTMPYAVLMDWGMPNGTATVAAYADGTASVYLSSGGGFLGGGQSHESISNAARTMVQLAGE